MQSAEGCSQEAQTTDPLRPDHRMRDWLLPNPRLNCYITRAPIITKVQNLTIKLRPIKKDSLGKPKGNRGDKIKDSRRDSLKCLPQKLFLQNSHSLN